MFDFDNMESFFGTELSTETSKPSKKAGKETKVSVTDADSVDLDTSDEDLEENSLGEVPAKASAAKGGKSSKVSSPTGESAVTLPCQVCARDFKVTVEQLDTCTINGLVKYLVEMGYVELESSSVNLIVASKGAEVYVTSPQVAAASNTLVDMDEKSVLVCAGMLQMELSETDFPDLDADEISVNHLVEKWERVNSDYSSCSLSYDIATSVAIPIISKTSVKEFKIPFVVDYFGTKTEITEGDFLLKEKITADELTEYLFPNVKCNIEYKELNGVIYHEFIAKKGQELIKSIDRKEWMMNSSKTVAENKKAAVKYALPFNVYFVNLGITMPLESSMFGDRSKLTESDVIEYLKPSYSILRNSDRQVDCFFSEETKTLSIALVSGKKGACALEAEADDLNGPGLWKLIRSAEEYFAALKSDNFLGHYHGFDTSRRVESTPIGSFVGICGTEKECTTVKSVELHLNIPKIPKALFDTICLDFRFHPMEERIIQVYWDTIARKHVLVYPEETEASKMQITYRFGTMPRHMKLVLTVHSHNTMAPSFSKTDDADEALTGIYGVVGTVNVSPTACFRVGMEGAFTPIPYSQLFEEV